MRRIAASRVFFSEKEYSSNTIVEIYGATVVNHHSIESETAMTEWLGGAIVLTPNEELDHSSVSSVSDFYHQEEEYIPSSPHPSSIKKTGNGQIKLFAYHISAFNLSDNTLSPQSVIRKIVD